MLYTANYKEEEASSVHEGELLSSGSSEIYDNKVEDDDRNSAEDNNYDVDVDVNNNNDVDGDVDGGGDRNSGARVGYMEWLGFLSLSAQTEALGAMAKTKASSLTASIKIEAGKSKS